MKLLFCEVCRDLVRPVTGQRSEPRFCICKRHAIWGLDDSHAAVRVFDRLGVDGVPEEPAAYVVLISNRLLDLDEPMQPETAAALLAAQRNSWFKSHASLVVRVRPGEHPKTAWSDLPTDEGGTHWGTVRSADEPKA
jgi:hypothetical protein